MSLNDLACDVVGEGLHGDLFFVRVTYFLRCIIMICHLPCSTH